MPTADRPWRGAWTLQGSVGGYAATLDTTPRVQPVVARLQAQLLMRRSLAHDRAFVTVTQIGAAGGRDLPPQAMVFAGGPWSAPGYDFASFATQAMLAQRLEFQQPLPGPVIPLGRYGKAPGRITLAPFVQAVAIGTPSSSVQQALHPSAPRRVSGVYPSVGTGVLFFFDLLRVDVARGLRDGTWRFGIDIDRAFWSVM